MSEAILIGLAAIVVFGVGAQWLAWRFGVPAIILLLATGLLVGPVAGWLEPDYLFGDLLLPLVSLSVAIILFEGGLNLKIAELRRTGSVVFSLVTVGGAATWLLTALGAYYLVGLDMGLSVLLGAILVVTGPTVIMPLLRVVRPRRRVAAVLKWEGIVIDPLGVILAVLVYEAVLVGGATDTASEVLIGLGRTSLVGGFVGMLGAVLMILLLKRYWVPDFLHSPVTLMVVLSVFAAANVLQAESGLLSTTVMGIVLANQKFVSVSHILEFKENLRVLLISTLFILLAARLPREALEYLNFRTIGFLAFLILIVRPVSVLLSTLFSELDWRERTFIGVMAPRGIVAAAVASIFALRLADQGYAQADMLVPLTFLVIIGTVAIYGLAAKPLARRLKVAEPNPQGALIIGAHPWAITIGRALEGKGFRVLLVDTNWYQVRAARAAGLEAHQGSILSETVLDELELDGIGHVLAMTPNDHVNSLAAIFLSQAFGRAHVFQLPSHKEGKNNDDTVSQELRGRNLFGPDMNFESLTEKFAQGAVVKATKITDEFDFDDFRALYGESAEPLFLITNGGHLAPTTADTRVTPRPGQTVISLVAPTAEPAVRAAVRPSAEERGG